MSIQELTERMAALKAQMKTDGARLVGERVKELFAAALPGVEPLAVRWQQYTPYFNDGDPCVFRSNAAYGSMKFAEVPANTREADRGDDFHEEYDFADRSGAHAVALRAITGEIAKIPDEILLAAFGDHVQVTITKQPDGGVEVAVDEYDHD